jgi:hypothetical protein
MRSLYKGYFQKSKVFLYPLLGIPRGISTVPEETYIAWEDRIHPAEEKLICHYTCTEHPDFYNFRKNVILKHTLLADIVLGKNQEEIYVFDFAGFNMDFVNFINGKYSQLSEPTKNAILDFFLDSDRTGELILSYLNPSEHYDDYARLLGVEKELLRQVGELCTRPDLKRETLTIKL